LKKFPAKYFKIILVASVFPEPLSPEIIIPWFLLSSNKFWNVLSAILNKCGGGGFLIYFYKS